MDVWLPDTLTAASLAASRVPAGTDRLRLRLPPPASASARLMPASTLLTSSTTARPDGALICGGSFTATTPSGRVAPAARPPSSCTVKLTVRTAVEGASLGVSKHTARATACTLALTALALKVTTRALPALTLAALMLPTVMPPTTTLLPLRLAPAPHRDRRSEVSAPAVICTRTSPAAQRLLASLTAMAASTGSGAAFSL